MATVTSRSVGVVEPARIERLLRHAVTAPTAATTTTASPRDGAPLADLPLSAPDDVDSAARDVRTGCRSWSRVPPVERARVLSRAHDLLLEQQVELCDLVQLETGTTRRDAFSEVVDAALTARYYASRGPRMLRSRRRAGAVPVLSHVVETPRPVGVVGLLPSSSRPLAGPAADLLPALLAGNGVLLRPEPATSLTTLFLTDLLHQAGLPHRVLRVVLGDVETAVVAACDLALRSGAHRDVPGAGPDAVTPITAAEPRRNGNTVYVAADADLARAVPGAVQSAFAHTGGCDTSAEWILVHRDVARDFLLRFVPAVQRLRVGLDLEFGPDLGSLPGPASFARVVDHVDDAVACGAEILTGGRSLPQIGPYVYAPTVLQDVPDSARMSREATSGPVVAVHVVDSEADAVARLGAGTVVSVWSRDVPRVRRLAGLLDAATVTINDAATVATTAKDATVRTAAAGCRQGRSALFRFTRPQTVATARWVSTTPPRDADAARYVTRILRALP